MRISVVNLTFSDMIKYNDYEIGGMILKIPVHTAHNELFIMGDFKDIFETIQNFENKAYEKTQELEQEKINKYNELKKYEGELLTEINNIDRDDVSQISKRVGLQKELATTQWRLRSIREDLQQLGEYFGMQARFRRVSQKQHSKTG